MFTGPTFVTLDAKGRLSVPTKHRESLTAAGGQMTVTKHPQRCLMIWPRPEWEQFASRVFAFPFEAQGLKRLFLGNATEVEMDGTGRVLISPELREYAALSRDTLLLGMGDHFELWDKAAYTAHEDEVIKGAMSDAVKDFAF